MLSIFDISDIITVMNKIVLSVIVLLGLVLAAGVYVNSQKPAEISIDKEQALTVQAADHVYGDREADVVVYEYLDFQCPACAAYFPVVQELKADLPENVAIVTRHFPLNFHLQARDAAYAYEAAIKQDQGEGMKALLFTRQDEWSQNGSAITLFERYAEELGLDAEQFKADRDSEETRAIVEFGLDTGFAAGVNSTPSFFLGTEKIAPRSTDDFLALITTALASVPEQAEVADVATTTEETTATTTE